MKTDEIPQDESALKNFTKEVCYAKNSDGNYETVLSKGWDVKRDALDAAWDDIEIQKEEAIIAFNEKTKSALYFHMLNNLMDTTLLAQYTGYWKFTVNRHMKPSVFNKLKDSKLAVYANLFKISIQELKEIKS